MNTLFLILATPFVIYITCVRPFQTERISRGTVKHPNPKFRLMFYRRSIMFKIVSSAYVVAIMALTGQPLARLIAVKAGLPLLPSDFVLTMLVLGLELLVLTELLNRFTSVRHVLLVGDIEAIVPRNTKERLWWVPTAIAAASARSWCTAALLFIF